MSWWGAAGVLLAVSVAFAGGVAAGLARRRARLARVAEGAAELARGNLAHRVIMPGDDEVARMAASLNELADAVQRERESSTSRDAARRRLLADISHDLRTPITSIAGYTDALQRGLGDEPERYLAVIAGKIDDLAQLTDDLFYAARIDAGDLELRRERVDVAEALRRCVLGFEPQLAGAGADVRIEAPESRCDAEADASAIARVLANLIGNGLRHADGMTRFAATLTEDGASWEVRLTNDGAALPDDMERLFARGVSSPAGGTGLGLAIARELAERMGGSVMAERLDGAVASFVFTLPRADFSES